MPRRSSPARTSGSPPGAARSSGPRLREKAAPVPDWRGQDTLGGKVNDSYEWITGLYKADGTEVDNYPVGM